MDSESLYTRILSVGIVLNAVACTEETISEALWPKIIEVIYKVLEVDQRKMVKLKSFIDHPYLSGVKNII